jgi:hypothetical protein
MGNRRVLATTALALSVAVAFAPLATAQQREPKLEVTPGVSNGGIVNVRTGPCDTFSTVTSPGLKEPITLTLMPRDPGRLHGSGRAVAESGTYTATLQCGDKTLTEPFTVGPQEVVWSLSPVMIEPGGTITAKASIYNSGGCLPELPLTSPGFAAPLDVRDGDLGSLVGETTVITTPGTYEVVWQCQDQADRSVRTFRILGTPPTTTTPPPPGNPKPKPPIIKPKGAADTGGGGTV